MQAARAKPDLLGKMHMLPVKAAVITTNSKLRATEEKWVKSKQGDRQMERPEAKVER